jgi:hypothetical protein
MNKKMMSEDDDIENMGIMQGFMDSMADEGDDEGDEDPEMMLERRPNSPEILMNNLRGDMRSVDARRDELADLVGYQAATETPEQVLAMLQPILAQQGGGGIGALPQSQDMAQGPQPPMMGGAPGMPPPGMPPMPADAGMAPPPDQGGIAALMASMGGGAPGGAPAGPAGASGMPPSDMPPIAMARGGYVQNFQAGSSPAGVTPVAETDDSDKELLAYPPEMVTAAKAQMNALMAQQPATVPTLAQGMKTRLPEYQALLGADKGRGNAEAQMLFELGQRAFSFGANTDERGQPLRGNFFGRLAGAAKTLPGAIGKHVSAMNDIDLKLKTLALQASEKDQDQVVAQNTKLLDTKARVFGDILKANAKIEAKKIQGLGNSIFGKGDWHWNVVNMPQMMERYSVGATSPEEDKLISSAITVFKTPKFETRFDPVTRDPYTVQTPVTIPDFVKQAETARAKLGKSTAATPAIVPPGNPARVQPAPAAAVESNVDQGAPTTAATTVTPVANPAALTTTPVAPATPGKISLWNDRFKIAGPAAAVIGAVSSFPGLGDPAADITLARQNAELDAERLIETMLKSTQGSVTEQKRLEKVLNIRPSAWNDPDAYGTRLIALGSALQSGIREFDQQGSSSSSLSPDAKGKARQKAMEYRKFYSELGLPPAVYSEADIAKYPPGTEVLVNGTTLKRIKVPQ